MPHLHGSIPVIHQVDFKIVHVFSFLQNQQYWKVGRYTCLNKAPKFSAGRCFQSSWSTILWIGYLPIYIAAGGKYVFFFDTVETLKCLRRKTAYSVQGLILAPGQEINNNKMQHRSAQNCDGLQSRTDLLIKLATCPPWPSLFSLIQ